MSDNIQVILMPSNENVVPKEKHLYISQTIFGDKYLCFDIRNEKQYWFPQNIYFVSNEEIKYNDFGYYYNDDIDGKKGIGEYIENDIFENLVFITPHKDKLTIDNHEIFGEHKRYTFKKVIASNCLSSKNISDEFIQYYVEQYQKGNIINFISKETLKLYVR